MIPRPDTNIQNSQDSQDSGEQDEAEDEEERLRKGEELPKFKTLLGDLQAEVDMRAFAALVHEVFVNVVADIRTELLLPTALREAHALAKEREAAAGSAPGLELLRDLHEKLLRKDPAVRIGVSEAAAHPWVELIAPPPPAPPAV